MRPTYEATLCDLPLTHDSCSVIYLSRVLPGRSAYDPEVTVLNVTGTLGGRGLPSIV